LIQHSNTDGSRHLTQLTGQSRNIALVVIRYIQQQ